MIKEESKKFTKTVAPGFHVGVNTVGQSLRNLNLQLRSEPAQKLKPLRTYTPTTSDESVSEPELTEEQIKRKKIYRRRILNLPENATDAECDAKEKELRLHKYPSTSEEEDEKLIHGRTKYRNSKSKSRKKKRRDLKRKSKTRRRKSKTHRK